MADTTVKTRGSVKPDLEITISDAAGTADFSGVTAGDITVIGEQGALIKFSSPASSFTAAPDGKSGIVKREWDPEDVNVAGHLWVTVMVEWADAEPQYFPPSGPLRIDIVRAPGD